MNESLRPWLDSEMRNYESALSTSDQDAFVRQGSQCGHLDFLNTGADNCPARLTVGPDYWVYFRGTCQTYRDGTQSLWESK